jgi:hypothetical protein
MLGLSIWWIEASALGLDARIDALLDADASAMLRRCGGGRDARPQARARSSARMPRHPFDFVFQRSAIGPVHDMGDGNAELRAEGLVRELPSTEVWQEAICDLCRWPLVPGLALVATATAIDAELEIESRCGSICEPQRPSNRLLATGAIEADENESRGVPSPGASQSIASYEASVLPLPGRRLDIPDNPRAAPRSRAACCRVSHSWRPSPFSGIDTTGTATSMNSAWCSLIALRRSSSSRRAVSVLIGFARASGDLARRRGCAMRHLTYSSQALFSMSASVRSHHHSARRSSRTIVGNDRVYWGVPWLETVRS